jgi:transcription initiation factor TFIID subunit 11
MSLASASVVGGPKKRRGRKPKANDTESAVGGKAKSAVSGTSGSRKRKHSIASADDEEEEGGEEMAVELDARSAEEKQKEVEHRAMLVNALDPEQMERYTAWRSSKLSDATVRRVSCLSL